MSRDWEDERAGVRKQERDERVAEAKAAVKRAGLRAVTSNTRKSAEDLAAEHRDAQRATQAAEVTDDNWDGDDA